MQVYVAAFSISGYAWASWRYRYKPFNPVLGETYESHREDRGFHYISEQVISRGGKCNKLYKPPNLGLEHTLMLRFVFVLFFVLYLRLAITLPSQPATQSQKTSLSGKVRAECMKMSAKSICTVCEDKDLFPSVRLLSDQRWKNKFWGKSVEIISSGLVNVTLPK